MSGARVVLLGALLAVASPLAAQRQEPSQFRAAGVAVIFKPVAGNDVVAVRLYVRGGSAAVTPATAGIERLIGVLATRGTDKYARDQFAARTARTGAEIGAEVTHDYTVLTLRTVREHWDESWDLFTQAALHPAFPDSELALARDQLVNELRQRDDDPDGRLARLGDSLFYAGNPYAVDPAGTPASLAALTRDDLVQWHRRRMTRENLLLVVVGNLTRADLGSKAAAAFGGLPARGGAAAAVAVPPARAPEVAVVPRALPTNYISGVFAAPSAADPDYAAMRVAIDVLSKRLFEEVRTKRNLSYAPFAGMSNLRLNTGQLYVSAVEPDTTLKVMRHEVERLKSEPIPVTQLGETVNGFLTRYFLRQEANMNQAATLGAYELVGGGWRRADTFLERVRAVTPADVQRVARTYLKGVRFAVVGDSTKVDRALFTSM